MPDKASVQPPGIDLEGKKVRFDYIKSNFFRVVYVQGIFGGPGPRREIQMAVWNERWPIPKQTTHVLGPDGKLGDEITAERVSRDAVVREVETELIMDVATATLMAKWLLDQVAHIEAAQATSQERAR